MEDHLENIFGDQRILKTAPGGPGLGTHYSLGLAISGGGHRATLFGLGVLMAMRDAGREPTQIASVSGGSITNAVLARNYFARAPDDMKGMSRDELWLSETQALFDTIVEKGILTKGWIRVILILMALPPLALVVSSALGAAPSWYVTLIGLAIWITLILLRGLLVEWLITKRFFADAPGVVHLSDLNSKKSTSPVEHVICCTDLVTGRPFYASSRDGGHIYRIYEDRPPGVGPRTTRPWSQEKEMENLGIQYETPRIPLAALIRASAGFPGIPPRRFRFSALDSDDNSADSKRVPPVAFLSDGGIWSNLATQPFEDGYLWGVDGPWVVVVADASAPLDHVKPFGFHLPGFAEILALVRQAVILTINTVAPRRQRYQDWIRRELRAPRSARFEVERLYPVVSTLETPKDVAERLTAAILSEDRNGHFLDESERKWRNERREVTRVRAQQLRETENDFASEKEKQAENDRVDAKAKEKYALLRKLASCDDTPQAEDPVSFYPTTLDRVDREIALALVGRAYANTSLTLYLTGLADELITPTGWLRG